MWSPDTRGRSTFVSIRSRPAAAACQLPHRSPGLPFQSRLELPSAPFADMDATDQNSQDGAVATQDMIPVSSSITSPDTSQSPFERLPEDVLAQIVAEVRSQSVFNLWREKYERVIVLCTVPRGNSLSTSCPGPTVWSYSLQGPPLLSPFQSFSTVNRQIHGICQPLLWKVSSQVIEFKSCNLIFSTLGSIYAH